jgi:hypothetical protein
MSWSRPLLHEITLNDGRHLTTLDDVAEVVLALPDPQLQKTCWDDAIECLIDSAISNPSALAQAEDKIATALKIEGLI